MPRTFAHFKRFIAKENLQSILLKGFDKSNASAFEHYLKSKMMSVSAHSVLRLNYVTLLLLLLLLLLLFLQM